MIASPDIPLSALLDGFSYLVWGIPRNCALCNAPLSSQNVAPDVPGVCRSCVLAMSITMAKVCRFCGLPVRGTVERCSDCASTYHVFESHRSAGLYSGGLKNAILRLKYDGERHLSRPLGSLIARAAAEFLPCDLVVPVPLDPVGRRRRGFNQASDLAAEVGRVLGLPARSVLRREKRTLHQAGLDRNMRLRNIRGSMSAWSRGAADSVIGARILLVDDVMTTGATLDEAATALMGMGASSVFATTAARTIHR